MHFREFWKNQSPHNEAPVEEIGRYLHPNVKYRMVPVGEIEANYGINREIDDDKVKKIHSILSEKGTIKPVFTDTYRSRPNLIDGHHRLEAMKLAGLDEIPTYEFQGNLGDLPIGERREIRRKYEDSKSHYKVDLNKSVTEEEMPGSSESNIVNDNFFDLRERNADKSFKNAWKSLSSSPHSIEVYPKGREWVTAWHDGHTRFENVYEDRLQAEQKASNLRGDLMTYEDRLPIGKSFSKSSDALTRKEVNEVQEYIEGLQSKGRNASQIIRSLQSYNDKLADYYKAKRAFDTANKNGQTEEVLDSADELGIDKFRVVINPSACKECRKKTDNGERIFTEKDLTKSGYGHRPPFHPSCYCTLIPA